MPQMKRHRRQPSRPRKHVRIAQPLAPPSHIFLRQLQCMDYRPPHRIKLPMRPPHPRLSRLIYHPEIHLSSPLKPRSSTISSSQNWQTHNSTRSLVPQPTFLAPQQKSRLTIPAAPPHTNENFFQVSIHLILLVCSHAQAFWNERKTTRKSARLATDLPKGTRQVGPRLWFANSAKTQDVAPLAPCGCQHSLPSAQ